MNARKALARARAVLGEGPQAERDAQILLGHAAGLERATLHRLADMEIDPRIFDSFEGFVARRSHGEPVAQILGYRDFWNHRFRVTADVLDPRPDTETLVAAALERPFARVLDLGTGSGCIVISLLAARPQAHGVGVDVSAPALAVAAANAREIGVADRLELRASDWFAAVEGVFDLIVSNPPYIAETEMAALAPEVRDWEPRPALTPGGDGLDAYRAIAEGAPAHLAPGGWLMAEIGPAQGADVSSLFAAAGLAHPRVLKDLDGRDRVVVARAMGPEPGVA